MPSHGRLSSQWLAIFSLAVSVSGVLVADFDNCLPTSIRNHDPPLLQWVPLFVDASFVRNNGSSYELSLTHYGNVTGQATEGPYPPPDAPSWSDPDDAFGKIVNFSASTRVYTALFQNYDVLTYTAYNAPAQEFYKSVVSGDLPIGPTFFPDNASDPMSFPAFSVAHAYETSFGFTSMVATLRIQSGDANNLDIACISTKVTPRMSDLASEAIAYVPAAILIVVAVATLMASMLSPWGTMDVFRWSSNYGRDIDLLRLVTPGFGDCLQYIQFVVLTGSLSLNYPGYYQPAVSYASWSTLMFNQSFVSSGDGRENPVDGLYVTNSTYGLSRTSQLVGLEEPQDIWAGAVIWTLVIIIVVVLICQLGFLARNFLRRIFKVSVEDLRSKNLPWTAGNLVRIVCNFFLLPLVSFTLFQLVIAPESPTVVIIFTVILLVLILAFLAWTLRLISTTKPRSRLFDDLPTVLLYGPLYNTYSDDAAPFALIPTLLTLIRGVAVGAIQPSGIAQLVVLAICEVVFCLTLFAFRPFQSQTSMNAYHASFASVRLATVLLMVAFAPTLGVNEGSKGWIGYVILLLHAIVLVFGFFLNAIQTIVEVAARMAGAGGDQGTGAIARGGLVKVFGRRQLSKRRRPASLRHSMNSGAAMLGDDADGKSLQFGERARSLSASSAILLRSEPRLSAHLDRTTSQMTMGDIPVEGYSAIAGNDAGPSRRPDLQVRTEASDPYYRPPRARRATGELMTPGAKSRESRSDSVDWANYSSSPPEFARPGAFSPQMAPSPAYMKAREGAETPIGNPQDPDVDYAVREVDSYYGLRGPALSSQPTRKLKTGPADPVGPVSSATGWFKGMLGGKKKDTGKGFQVVRSSRVPHVADEEQQLQPIDEPFHDSPPPQDAYLPGEPTRSGIGTRERNVSSPPKRIPIDYDEEEEADVTEAPIVSERPPSLDPIQALGGLDIPSRWSSIVSKRLSTRRPDPGQAHTTQMEPLVSRKHDSGEVEPFPGIPAAAPDDSGGVDTSYHGAFAR